MKSNPKIMQGASAVLACILFLAFLIVTYNNSTADASTFTFVVPKVATSSPVALGAGPAAQLLVATSTNCVSRKITTYANPVMLTFDGSLPNGQRGHLQAASTTTDYDNGSSGCGPIYGYSYASSSVMVSVFNEN